MEKSSVIREDEDPIALQLLRASLDENLRLMAQRANLLLGQGYGVREAASMAFRTYRNDRELLVYALAQVERMRCPDDFLEASPPPQPYVVHHDGAVEELEAAPPGQVVSAAQRGLVEALAELDRQTGRRYAEGS